MEDYLSDARKIFAGTKYEASEKDIRMLADNMAFLQKRGLSELNKRLVDARKHTKIFETIAEHNFAVILISQHSTTIPISYEPDIGLPRPIDFKVEIGDITYWIQMKDLAKLKRENRQNKMIQQIKREAKEIKVGKFFSCTLSDDFKESSLPKLINFIKDKAASAAEEEVFLFTDNKNQKAEIKFWSANKQLSELTLGYAGDLEIVEITGLAREQIKQSLLNTVGAFKEVGQRNINLIVMEADNKEDIDICAALFGTEHEIIGKDSLSWSRKDDGLFSEPDFSNKVAGVITMKRKSEKRKLSSEEERFVESFAKQRKIIPEQYKEQIRQNLPISNYYQILYLNNGFKYHLENIKKLLCFDKVVYYNMRPPMGKGSFENSECIPNKSNSG